MTEDEVLALVEQTRKQVAGRVPVPVTDIAKDLGLEIYSLDLSIFRKSVPSSAIFFEPDTNPKKWRIVVNEKESLERKRFSIAFEIGNYLINQGKESIDAFKADGSIDIENSYLPKGDLEKAFFFAINLLLPVSELKTRSCDAENVLRLAEEFEVSEKLVTRQISNLRSGGTFASGTYVNTH